jgi:hypothetical protein
VELVVAIVRLSGKHREVQTRLPFKYFGAMLENVVVSVANEQAKCSNTIRGKGIMIFIIIITMLVYR